MFSSRFWTEKLPEQGSIAYQQEHFTLSEQPVESQAAEKARELIQNIQKRGSLAFVQECVKGLKPYRVRVLLDIFVHNLTRLFQQALLSNLPGTDVVMSESARAGKRPMLLRHEKEADLYSANKINGANGLAAYFALSLKFKQRLHPSCPRQYDKEGNELHDTSHPPMTKRIAYLWPFLSESARRKVKELTDIPSIKNLP